MDPQLHLRLMHAALNEIASMQDHFMTLGCKSATEKLASFLSVLATRIGKPLGAYTKFVLPMPRSDIADFLGLTPETISRVFTRLRKQGTIAIDKVNTVTVLNSDDLLEMVELA